MKNKRFEDAKEKKMKRLYKKMTPKYINYDFITA